MTASTFKSLLKCLTLWFTTDASLSGSAADNPRQIAAHLDVDWQNFLGRHDMIWEQLPRQWNEGAFLGNGQARRGTQEPANLARASAAVTGGSGEVVTRPTK